MPIGGGYWPYPLGPGGWLIPEKLFVLLFYIGYLGAVDADDLAVLIDASFDYCILKVPSTDIPATEPVSLCKC